MRTTVRKARVFFWVALAQQALKMHFEVFQVAKTASKEKPPKQPPMTTASSHHSWLRRAFTAARFWVHKPFSRSAASYFMEIKELSLLSNSQTTVKFFEEATDGVSSTYFVYLLESPHQHESSQFGIVFWSASRLIVIGFFYHQV